jgi:hypothetical protein
VLVCWLLIEQECSGYTDCSGISRAETADVSNYVTELGRSELQPADLSAIHVS